MKTPKEKAKELVDKFIDIMPSLAIQTGKTINDHAKKCALITIQELLSEIPKFEYGHPILVVIELEYLQEVKTEIEKL